MSEYLLKAVKLQHVQRYNMWRSNQCLPTVLYFETLNFNWLDLLPYNYYQHSKREHMYMHARVHMCM